MVDGHGGNRNVGGRQSNTFAPVVAFQQTSQTGHRLGNGIVLETFEQFRGASLFVAPHAGVNFGYVDRAAGHGSACR